MFDLHRQLPPTSFDPFIIGSFSKTPLSFYLLEEYLAYLITRSLGAPTSSLRPFGPPWLRPYRPSGAQAVWPMQMCPWCMYPLCDVCINDACIHCACIHDASIHDTCIHDACSCIHDACIQDACSCMHDACSCIHDACSCIHDAYIHDLWSWYMHAWCISYPNTRDYDAHMYDAFIQSMMNVSMNSMILDHDTWCMYPWCMLMYAWCMYPWCMFMYPWCMFM